MEKKYNVTIDLFKPNLPGAIDSNAFVQQTLKDQLISDIYSVALTEESPQNKMRHNAIQNKSISEAGRQLFFIDGTRGAGKTTFMNDIVNSFNNCSEIHALRCIDPTKLPQIEPVLVTVIAQLNTEVTKKIRSTSGWGPEYISEKDEWQKCLQNISRAICLLGNKEYSRDYFDESLELNSLLADASDGLGLEEQFSKLLKQACDILECKAILVAFDDIDTQFNTGWQVLEAIRKYFNSPQLILLMTGDLRLYSQLIRGKQYGNYDSVMLNEEASEAEKLNRNVMVNHLEQQYLIKLIPVHRRINLQSLHQLVTEENETISIITTQEHDTNKTRVIKSLQDAVSDMLSDGLNLRVGPDLNIFSNEILKQPIRLVIQLLQHYYQQKELKQKRLPSADIFCEAIRSTMLGSIYKAGLTYDSTDAHIGVIAKDIFNYTLMDGDTNTGFYLRPQSESEIIRSSAIYLASMVSKTAEGSLWKTLYLMLAGCGSVTLYDELAQANSLKFPPEQIEKAFKTYIGLGRSESLMHWANRSNAALCPVNQDNTLGVHPGLLRLNRSKPKTSKPIPKTEIYTSDNETHFMAKLAVDIASSDLAGKNMHSFISIPNLLGGITVLIEGYASIILENDADIDNKLAALLSKIAFRTTCSAPSWASDERQITNDSEIDADESQFDTETSIDKDFKSSVAIIKTWLELVVRLEVNIHTSSILIGKIWTRLYFNLKNIAEEHSSNIGTENGLLGTNATDTNAAKIMRFNVIALLHAVLFEEESYRKTAQTPIFTGISDRKNPVTSIDSFVNKLEKLANIEKQKTSSFKTDQDLPIFYLLITCPLLHPFLFSTGSILESQRAKTKESNFDTLMVNLNKGIYSKYTPKMYALEKLNTASITASRAKPAPAAPAPAAPAAEKSQASEKKASESPDGN
ncbi:archaeal ATPase [Aeromonas hydrophila]|uniref:archaeal ATPase n=1 Tax=Aeromonas hydrophila TaxID=644 RepID=UPI000F52CEB7|nr:archaeal ATPase [Aeromonas hydrophila]RQM70015.1 archaeal ATPase [Aeromonas hydrophila]